ncbi:hypothetical protein ACFQE0_04970 [Methylobacterium komagatae]|uniref:DUF4259 domain-containing protein n=1 Tax=Methylobacterium komagatae TaxID=374425 RepID=A0ABW2BFB3_9HYPH
MQADETAVADEVIGRGRVPDTVASVSTAANMLRQVAVALGIPPEDLARTAIPPCDRARFVAETAEALELFAKITDPDMRRESLAFLRSVVHLHERR